MAALRAGVASITDRCLPAVHNVGGIGVGVGVEYN